MMTDLTDFPNFEMNRTVIDEPAMVMGFIPTDLHAQLRRMAAEQGCSESYLVSDFVKTALSAASPHKAGLRREPQ